MSNEHWQGKVLDDKHVKKSVPFAWYTLLTIFFILVLILCYRGCTNSSVSFLGLEIFQCDTILIRDTVHHDRALPITSQQVDSILKAHPSKVVVKDKSTPAISQKNVKGKNEVNQNSGTNFGNIGGTGNSVTNNFFGKPTSHPTAELLDDIEKALVNKNEEIQVFALFGSADSYEFAQELAGLLRERGYTNLGLTSGTMSPTPPKGVSLRKSGDLKIIAVRVD